MDKETVESNIIVVTGPESSGKTVLAEALALHYNCSWQPELSRTYVEQLNRPYNYNDVEVIAQKQITQFSQAVQENKPIFFDTGLIITKVWFDIVYGRSPGWLISAIEQLPKCLHLLCNTDLPWVPDKVRENGGEMRNKLFEIYKDELQKFNFTFRIIEGTGINRTNNATKIIDSFKI